MEESDPVPETIVEEAEFNDWKEERGVMTINEEVLLSYFLNLKKR
jgi:hypothetical protein